MERIGKALQGMWDTYCQMSGIMVMAGIISYGVLSAFSYDGPVVETTDGPHVASAKIPYRGELVYRISTKRNASCPGTSIIEFTSLDVQPVRVLLNRPINTPMVQRSDDARVHVELPRSVFPGKWTYTLSVDSQCPTYTRQDIVAQFEIQVEEESSNGK